MAASDLELAAGSAPEGERRDGAFDAPERLLWSLMQRFESLALERYGAHAPELATPGKRELVAHLSAIGRDDAGLAASDLGGPAEALLARAREGGEASALLVQGVVLEHLAQAIYRIAETSGRTGAASQALAARGLRASVEVTGLVGQRIAARIGTGDALYATFADVSHDVLAALDALAEPVDRVFGERFGLRFADVMGEFTADLVTACTALGMQRRKVVAHLAGAAMGL